MQTLIVRFWKRTFLHRSVIVKSQHIKIEFVTRPGAPLLAHKTYVISFFPHHRKRPTWNGSSLVASCGYLTSRRAAPSLPLSTLSQLQKAFIICSSGYLWKFAAGPARSKRNSWKRWVCHFNNSHYSLCPLLIVVLNRAGDKRGDRDSPSSITHCSHFWLVLA